MSKSFESQSLTSSAGKKNKFKLASFLKGIFQVGKKFIDDDIWYIVRNILPAPLVKILNPFLVGTLVTISICIEIFSAVKDLIEVIKEKLQFKSRIAADTAVIALGVGGVGMGGALVANGFGAAVAGTTVIPVILPMITVAMFSILLAREIYRLKVIKEKEQIARLNYLAMKKEIFHEIELARQQRMVLEHQRIKLNNLFGPNSSSAIFSQLTELENINQEIEVIDNRITECETQSDQLDGMYQPYIDQLQERERSVAFAGAELFTSLLVLASAIIGAAALFGLGFLTFGTLPLFLGLSFSIILLITSASVSGGFRLFELIDKENNYFVSNKLRELIFGPLPNKKLLLDMQSELYDKKDQSFEMQDISTSKLMRAMPVCTVKEKIVDEVEMQERFSKQSEPTMNSPAPCKSSKEEEEDDFIPSWQMRRCYK